MNKTHTKPGFTMIEFTIACAFISFLVMTLALIIVYVTSIYQRGMTLKSVNSTGSDIIDEFSRAITSSPLISSPKVLCNYLPNNGLKSTCETSVNPGSKLIYQQFNAPARSISLKKSIGTNEIITDSVSLGGIFCTGEYTYLWNTGYVLNKDRYISSYEPFKVSVTLDGHTTEYTPRLLRLVDPGRQICAGNIIASGSYQNVRLDDEYILDYDTENILDISYGATEVIDSSENNLALYDLHIFYPLYHATTKQGFYSGTFLLGTLSGGVDVTASGDYCTDPPELSLSSEFSYCAINKFNFASRATGEE